MWWTCAWFWERISTVKLAAGKSDAEMTPRRKS